MLLNAQVLIMLPMRSMACRVVLRLTSLTQKETRTDSIQNKARFLREFGADADEEAEQTKGRPKPAEHRALFHGNTDDHFQLGIKTTR